MERGSQCRDRGCTRGCTGDDDPDHGRPERIAYLAGDSGGDARVGDIEPSRAAETACHQWDRHDAELRKALLSDRSGPMQQILDRAVERGEVAPTKLSPRVAEVAFDLYRQEIPMTLKAVPDEVAESIVDEVFLPLVTTRLACFCSDPRP